MQSRFEKLCIKFFYFNVEYFLSSIVHKVEYFWDNFTWKNIKVLFNEQFNWFWSTNHKHIGYALHFCRLFCRVALNKSNVVTITSGEIKSHGFHVLSESYYPLQTAVFLFGFLYNFMLYINHLGYFFSGFVCIVSLLLIVVTIFMWLDDIIIESYQFGCHSDRVRMGLRFGMLLFILSEVMFFFSFFLGYFHVALSPNMYIGCVWPPEHLQLFFNLGVPFFNTVLLVTSGAFLTAAHYNLVSSNQLLSLYFVCDNMYGAIAWGLIFLGCQIYEYIHLPFNINDSVFGSLFFMLTGFHGFHVIVGLCMLISVAYYVQCGVYNYEQHVGFECAAWYWHFVDVVWLFLFICVYMWGYDWFSYTNFLDLLVLDNSNLNINFIDNVLLVANNSPQQEDDSSQQNKKPRECPTDDETADGRPRPRRHHGFRSKDSIFIRAADGSLIGLYLAPDVQRPNCVGKCKIPVEKPPLTEKEFTDALEVYFILACACGILVATCIYG